MYRLLTPSHLCDTVPLHIESASLAAPIAQYLSASFRADRRLGRLVTYNDGIDPAREVISF